MIDMQHYDINTTFLHNKLRVLVFCWFDIQGRVNTEKI